MPHEFEFYGGSVCLDFTNTVDSRRLAELEEHLHGYPDLASWARQAGLVDESGEARLLRRAAERPDEARHAYAAAVDLREAVFRVFRALAEDAPAPAADLTTIQAAYTRAMSHARLDERAGRLGWAWPEDAPQLPAWLVARSAVELATVGPVDRIKVCASDSGCAGLFLDTSKNRSRRWCTMTGCGNEAKFRRQTARRRARNTVGNTAGNAAG
jgi:predicted RNA-binding Zn ribbon-like protein